MALTRPSARSFSIAGSACVDAGFQVIGIGIVKVQDVHVVQAQPVK